jgi:uncharacterized protein YoxC
MAEEKEKDPSEQKTGKKGAKKSRPARARDPQYVTVDEMMELIHTLNKGLELRDRSNQLLQQQIETNQKIIQRRGRLAKIAMYVIAIGIVVLGTSAGSIMYNMDHAMRIVSSNMDTMTGYMQTMSSSVLFMSEHINDMETSLDTMSDDVADINTNVLDMSGNVRMMSHSVIGMSHDTRRMERNMDNMIPW